MQILIHSIITEEINLHVQLENECHCMPDYCIGEIKLLTSLRAGVDL
jgi:hypothetical protein